MCTNNVPPVLQMFTGMSAVKSLPPVKVENHHGTWTPLFDSCYSGGYYDFGINKLYDSQEAYAKDAGKAMTAYNKEVFKGSGYTLGNAFVGGLAGLFNNPTFAATTAGGFLGGLGNFMSNLRKG